MVKLKISGKLDSLMTDLTSYIKDRSNELIRDKIKEELGQRKTLELLEANGYIDNENWQQTLIKDSVDSIRAVQLSRQFPDPIEESEFDNSVDVQVLNVDDTNNETTLFVSSTDEKLALRLGVHYHGGEIEKEDTLIAYNATKNVDFSSELETKIQEELGLVIKDKLIEELETELKNKKVKYGE